MTPLWQTPWIAVPIWTMATLVGVVVAQARIRSGAIALPPPASCPPTYGTEGGTLGEVPYVERRSANAGPHAKLPLLVVLHPRDVDPISFADWVAYRLPKPARVVAPVGFSTGDPAAVLRRWTDAAPDDPSYPAELADAAAALDAFLEAIRRCRPTVGPTVVAGYDEGAALAYVVASESPRYVGTVIGAAGMLEPAAPQTPVIVLHGRDDAVIPYEQIASAVGTMAAAGAEIRIVPMTGVGHSFAGALAVRWLEEVATALDAATASP